MSDSIEQVDDEINVEAERLAMITYGFERQYYFKLNIPMPPAFDDLLPYIQDAKIYAAKITLMNQEESK